MKEIRMGIAGSGRIASRFAEMLKEQEGVRLSCIYNPHMDSAEDFARRLQTEAYTGNLEELASLSDCVYIASPHETHIETARFLLERGRHVLCEKPLGFSQQEVKDLFELAKKQGAVFMEAVKTAYCPGFQALLETACSGKIGRIRDVEACFSRLTPTNLREIMDQDYGGSFTELASYTMLPIFKLMGTKFQKVQFQSLKAANGVDIYTKAFFDYGDQGTALLKTGLEVKSEGQLVIAGTKGYILAPSPWWMTRKFEVRYEDPGRIEKYEFPYEGSGLQYELEHFLKRICFPKEHKRECGMTAEESCAMAGVMERFLGERRSKPAVLKESEDIKIWAHRGCSMAFPENTLESFLAAAALPGITGIELDVQLTKDGRLAVIHDEKIDRTTDGFGMVKDLTWEELKEKKMILPDGKTTRVPLLEEVLEAMKPYCQKNGLLINIELKTGNIRYEGIEEETIRMVDRYGLKDSVVYSSFLPDSIKRIKELDPSARTAVLAGTIEECIDIAEQIGAEGLHPWVGGLNLKLPKEMEGTPVRAWNGEEPLYGDGRKLKNMDLRRYGIFGVTDVFTNVPERYLGKEKAEED